MGNSDNNPKKITVKPTSPTIQVNSVTNSPILIVRPFQGQSLRPISSRLKRKFHSESNLQANGLQSTDIGSTGTTQLASGSPVPRAKDSLGLHVSAQSGLLQRSGSVEPAAVTGLLPPTQLFEPIVTTADGEIDLNGYGHHGSLARQSYNLPEFNEQFEVIKGSRCRVGNKFVSLIKPRFSVDYINRKMVKLFPILAWLRNYNVKKNLIVDLIAGLTILVFQVPQSMGYSLIARVPPVHGLYTSFFPALVYSFMGTSRHCAVGTFAVVSLMTGSLVAQVLESQGSRPVDNPSEAVDVAMAISFLMGLYQLVFGIFRLGFFSVYMSEQLISGFTTACSFYVFTSQLSYLFGLHLPHRSGPLALVNTYRDLVTQIDHTNVPTLIISGTCCLIIMTFKFAVNPLIARHTRLAIPFPIELVLVILSTLASHFFSIRNRWGVQVVGPIPRGLPLPRLPRFDLIRELAISTIPLAIVAYTLTISVGKIFANRHKYKVDPNQELVALGATNLVSCLFSCIPSAASLSRSAVQESSGGRTQLVSLVNCAGLLFVLLYAGPLLSELPNCVLAAIIAVALKTLLIQVKDFTNYWRLSKLDASIWLITFFAVLLLDVDIGLYVGLGYSLLTLIYKSQRPKMYLLGFVNNSDVYVPVNRYASAHEIPGVKIYQFCGPLHFANIEYFNKGLSRKTGVTVKSVRSEREKMKRQLDKKWSTCEETHKFDLENGTLDTESVDGTLNGMTFDLSPSNLSHIIIDCSMFSYIDVAGVRQLRTTIQEYSHIGVKTFLACVAAHVHKMLEKDGFFRDIPPSHVYLTINDAVDNALRDRQVRFRSTSKSPSINVTPACSTVNLNPDGPVAGSITVVNKSSLETAAIIKDNHSNSSNIINNNGNHHQNQKQKTSVCLKSHHKCDDDKYSHEDDLTEKTKFLCCPKAHSP